MWGGELIFAKCQQDVRSLTKLKLLCAFCERWIFDQDLLKIHLIWRQVSRLGTRQREGYLCSMWETELAHWTHQLNKNIQQRYTVCLAHTISDNLNISEISAVGVQDFTYLRRIYGTINNINPCKTPVAGRGRFICPVPWWPLSLSAGWWWPSLGGPGWQSYWPGRLSLSPCAGGRTTHCAQCQGKILLPILV